MKTTFLIFTISFITFNLMAQNTSITKEKWHWNLPEMQDTSDGYAQVVKVDNILYISGTVTTDITPESIQRVYTLLEKSLNQFGATFQNVVKENLYTTDIEAMIKYNEARKKFYNGDFPAATWVQISRLFMPEAKLEIELIAHLPK